MKKERIFWGVFFILGAIFLLFSQTSFMKGLELNLWNIIWTILLVAIMVKSIARRRFFGIFLPLAFLIIIYDDPLGIDVASWTIIGAAVLLSIGCDIIFPHKWRDEWHNHCQSSGSVAFDEVVDTDCNEQVRQEVHFGSSIKYVNSDNFRGGHFECSFGSMKVYLTNAIMQEPQVTIFVENCFGGVELYVPREWTVVTHLESAFGGVEERGCRQPDGIHTLYIQGENSFGGITIIYI